MTYTEGECLESLREAAKEVEKCEVLCANCHREKQETYLNG